jgi:hypothetical protein
MHQPQRSTRSPSVQTYKLENASPGKGLDGDPTSYGRSNRPMGQRDGPIGSRGRAQLAIAAAHSSFSQYPPVTLPISLRRGCLPIWP